MLKKLIHRSPRILIVEDEKLIGWSIANVLHKLGYDTAVITCGKRAKEILLTTEFDFVITDLHLPSFSGLEIVSDVKKMNFNIPVLLISTLEEDEIHTLHKKYNIDYIIPKPFDLTQITSIVQNCLEYQYVAE